MAKRKGRTSSNEDLDADAREDFIDRTGRAPLATDVDIDAQPDEPDEPIAVPEEQLDPREGVVVDVDLLGERRAGPDVPDTADVPRHGSDALGPTLDYTPGATNPVGSGVWGNEERDVVDPEFAEFHGNVDPISHKWTFEDQYGQEWIVTGADGEFDFYVIGTDGEAVPIQSGSAGDIDDAIDRLGLTEDAEYAASLIGQFDHEATQAWNAFKKEFGVDDFEAGVGDAWDSFKKEFGIDAGADDDKLEDDAPGQDDTDETSDDSEDTSDDATDDTSDDTDTDTDDSSDDTDDDDDASGQAPDEDIDDEPVEEPTEEPAEEPDDAGSIDPETGHVVDPEAHVELTEEFIDRYPELGDDPTGHDVDPSPIEDDTRGELPEWEGTLPNDADPVYDLEEHKRLVEEHMDTMNEVDRQDVLIDWGDDGAPAIEPGEDPPEGTGPSPSPVEDTAMGAQSAASAQPDHGEGEDIEDISMPELDDMSMGDDLDGLADDADADLALVPPDDADLTIETEEVGDLDGL